jgi:sugar lactone lactonase YvrE
LRGSRMSHVFRMILVVASGMVAIGTSSRVTTMAAVQYRVVPSWAQLQPNAGGAEWEVIAAAADPKGSTLYAFRRADPPIVQLDPSSGKILKMFGQGMFVWPHGLKLDAQGNLWAADGTLGGNPPLVGPLKPAKQAGRGYQVTKLGPDGKVLMTLGKQGVAGVGPDAFDSPTDVIVAPNGDIFVTDGHNTSVARVVKFSKDGKFIKTWGKRGKGRGELTFPHGIALDSQRRLFVADRGNNRLQIFDQDGNFLAEWAQFGSPAGVAISADDTMVVSDTSKRRLTIGSAKDGLVMAVIEDVFADGVGIDDKHNIYTAEPMDHTIRKFVKQ